VVEYTAKRNRNRCPTHPGELLREDVIPATGKTKTEIAALLGIFRQHLYPNSSVMEPRSGFGCRALMILGRPNAAPLLAKPSRRCCIRSSIR
jgi:hypothetical protein